MLANPEMQVAPAGSISFQIAGPLEGETCLGGWREVGCAADEPGVMRGDGIEHLAGGVAAGEPLRVGREDGQVRVPALGKFAPLHAVELIGEVGMLAPVGFEQRSPSFAKA